MSLDLPGFTDPVLGAQAAFRAVLDAMSRPGRRIEIGTDLTPPNPLCQASAAVLLALVDHDTTLHLSGTQDAADWLAFHTGAPPAPPESANFIMALTLPDLATLAQGTDDAPELSATIILQVASLHTGQDFVLSGPGIETVQDLTVDGLPKTFAALWAQNHAAYPRGIDLILCHGTTLAALPRSVVIKER
jgi:alpha-D-ribose 1-methylphosphonate 5-triphosphate synthase subunit PhnH